MRRPIRHPKPGRQTVPEVIDDFPDFIPVTSAELDTVETYLSDLVDQLFSRVAEEQPTNREGNS